MTAALNRRELRSLAVIDNAAWCVSMWRAHGLGAQRTLGLVACDGAPPPFYPNAVTLDPEADPRAQAAWLAAMPVAGGLSVKDSFAALDLAPHGFRRLFDAQWLARPPRTPLQPQTPDLHWSLVEEGEDLADWEAAWRGEGAAGRPIFLPALLEDRAVGLMAGTLAGRIVAGCVLTPTVRTVGLSNVFGAYADAVAVAAMMFPDKPIVGYEHGEDLEAALEAGFDPLGPLTVWVTL